MTRYRYVGRIPTELANGRIVGLDDSVTNISSEDGHLVDRGLLIQLPDPPAVELLNPDEEPERPDQEKPAARTSIPKTSRNIKDKS